VSAACAFCGVPADAPSGARMDLVARTCGECATLRPEEPGAALRAAARVLGADEEDPHLREALTDDHHALDGLLYADPGDPLRSGRRAPQSEPWTHVPDATRDALRRARARGLELRVRGAARRKAAGESAPPSGPAGCLVCGRARASSWRRVTTAALTLGPALAEGHLCGACQTAHDEAGALGPSLVERAALAHAGVTWTEDVTVPGLTAWAATGEPPGEPWAWVDLRPPEPEPTIRDLLAEVAVLRAEVEVLKAAAP
jgi:hypothetical protein